MKNKLLAMALLSSCTMNVNAMTSAALEGLNKSQASVSTVTTMGTNLTQAGAATFNGFGVTPIAGTSVLGNGATAINATVQQLFGSSQWASGTTANNSTNPAFASGAQVVAGTTLIAIPAAAWAAIGRSAPTGTAITNLTPDQIVGLIGYNTGTAGASTRFVVFS